MLADPALGGADRELRRPVAAAANLAVVKPSEVLFPDFDDTLRQGFRRETELFFDSILREDRSALDLLTADYTFLNDRLARHYGIPNIKGSHFRRVTLTDENRRGLLGQGSILTMTSQPSDLAGVPRQVDSRQHSGHAAARSAAERAGAAGEDRRVRRRECRRCASGWRSTARTPRARPATR